VQDVTEHLEDMREYDVPYHVRFAIDTDVRCGHWFNVRCKVCMHMCLCVLCGARVRAHYKRLEYHSCAA